MLYSVEFQAGAIDDINRLDTAIAQRVRNRLDGLVENAESMRHRMLTGRLRGLFRLRVGDYRVLYTMDRANRTHNRACGEAPWRGISVKRRGE